METHGEGRTPMFGLGMQELLIIIVGYPLCFDRFGPLCDTSLHRGI